MTWRRYDAYTRRLTRSCPDPALACIASTGPIVLEARVCKKEHVYPMVPAGAALGDMVQMRPTHLPVLSQTMHTRAHTHPLKHSMRQRCRVAVQSCWLCSCSPPSLSLCLFFHLSFSMSRSLSLPLLPLLLLYVALSLLPLRLLYVALSLSGSPPLCRSFSLFFHLSSSMSLFPRGLLSCTVDVHTDRSIQWAAYSPFFVGVFVR